MMNLVQPLFTAVGFYRKIYYANAGVFITLSLTECF